jgi:excisionase family DNA binding protein
MNFEPEVLETVRIVRWPGLPPKIDKHRIKVHHVAYEHVYRKMDVDALLERFPTLNRAEIHAALSYYYANREEIEAIIREEDEWFSDPDAGSGFHITMEQALDPDFSLLITPQEIAHEYNITAEAVYQAVRRNTIPHRRSGTTILIPRWEAEKRWRNKSKRGRPKKSK